LTIKKYFSIFEVIRYRISEISEDGKPGGKSEEGGEAIENGKTKENTKMLYIDQMI